MACKFYCQVLKHNQINPVYGNPRTTKTTLNQYTHMIKLRQKLDIDDTPPQWLIHSARHPIQEQMPPATKAPTAKQSKPVTNPPQASSATSTPITHTNQHWPSIFTTNETIKSLQGKYSCILTDIFAGTGISARAINSTSPACLETFASDGLSLVNAVVVRKTKHAPGHTPPPANQPRLPKASSTKLSPALNSWLTSSNHSSTMNDAKPTPTLPPAHLQCSQHPPTQHSHRPQQ